MEELTPVSKFTEIKELLLNRKTLISSIIIMVLVLSLVIGLYLIKNPKIFKSKASEVKPQLTAEANLGKQIEDFKFSYQDLRKYLRSNKDIQLFGGGLVLSEFDDDDKVYAGHLGSFWSPPFYSSHTSGYLNNPQDYRKGFNLGLVFYNYGFGGGKPEEPSDLATEAFWYPSKMVVNKFYPGSGGGTDIKGVKVALPGVRGFGLKVTLTNKSPEDQSVGVLFMGSLSTFETLKTERFGWNWTFNPSANNKTNSSYDETENIILIEDPASSAFMAVGLSEVPDSWDLDDNFEGNNYGYALYSSFLTTGKGRLSKTDIDNNGQGTTFGLVSQAPSLPQNESHTFSLVAGLGETREEAINIVKNYRDKDIEAEVDKFWNTRLSTFFSSLPTFKSGDETLNKIYRNSALNYLVNKWTTLDSIGILAGFGQSTSFYPWMVGDAGFYPLAEPAFWKGQLKKLLGMDLGKCRAFDPVANNHLCDHAYTYNNVSMIDGVYRYVTTTSDFKFLDETIKGKTVLQHLIDLAAVDDKKEYGQGSLADFGNDNNLYEYNIHCTDPKNLPLQGQYTGLVVSPNAERVVSHHQIAELIRKTGNQEMAQTHQAKADQIKTALQTLWNPDQGWFDTISLYEPGNYEKGGAKRLAPKKTTFWGMYPLLLLQYEGLLTDEQAQKLLGNISKFRGEYGLTSVSTELRNNWCSRTDWHGPGLYSGATGAVLTGLFKNGQADLAYELLSPADGKGYAYLSQMPYFSQAFPSDQQTVGLLPAFLEGISMAQSYIEGMFGFYPNTKQTKIAPHIPADLLAKGPVSLTGLKAQSHVWDLTVDDAKNQTLSLKVSGTLGSVQADHFRFEYEMDGNLTANISNLEPNKNFIVTTEPISGGKGITINEVSDASGILKIKLSLNGHYLISGKVAVVTSQSPSASPQAASASQNEGIRDLNSDGVINSLDRILYEKNK